VGDEVRAAREGPDGGDREWLIAGEIASNRRIESPKLRAKSTLCPGLADSAQHRHGNP
jgi:hypothetical protein